MTRVSIALSLVVPLTLAPAIASGQGGGQFGWLRASPVSLFTPTDWEILRRNARDALDDAEDGTTASWQNPDTGHSGSVTVVSTFEEDGRRCRKATFRNEARGMKGEQTHRLCKVEDNSWKIVP